MMEEIGRRLGDAMAREIDHDIHHLVSPFACAGVITFAPDESLLRMLWRWVTNRSKHERPA